MTTVNGKSVNGSVRTIDPTTGNIIWEQATANWVMPALACANGVVVDGGGASGESAMEVRSAATGALLYSFDTGSQPFGPASVGDGRIIEGSTNSNVYAFGLPGGPTPTPGSTGPMASYLMESPSWNGSAGEVVDSSGNGFAGQSVGGVQTANATPALPGDPGSCRYATGFNGSTGYLSLGAPQLGFTNQVTVMAWVRWGIAPGSGNNWANIVSNNFSAADDTGPVLAPALAVQYRL